MTAQSVDRVPEAVSYIAGRIASGEIASREGLQQAKRKAARDFSLDRYVSNSEVLAALPTDGRQRFQEILRVHPRRSASGIVVVTAFSAPFSCPHGTCTFCPGGPTEGTPQSYLPASPGMRSALATEFDPFRQVRECLRKYTANGHDTSKVETIIEGGTFIAVPTDYQVSFVKGVYDGLNGTASSSLESAQSANEGAQSRCVGLTLESKPDWCRPRDIDLMLSYGITRLEIGVQSLRDSTLKRSNRGHTVEDSINAFQVARDAGLKTTVHMMPGLPGASPEEDLQDLRRLFDDESLRPDMMKVYPTLVVRGASLERQFQAGLYEPYELGTVVELLSQMKRFVPRWHRIMRIQREIPAYEISAGVTNGNLRELVLARARAKGSPCQCIRCREVALAEPSDLESEDELRLGLERYPASGGTELFASYEYGRSGRIAAFARLRLPSERAHREEMRGSAVVRELRVYGTVVGIGAKSGNAWQHRGLGASLMGEMERVAREEFGSSRLLVTSAVGTRNYYRRLGYERLGPYMVKQLTGSNNGNPTP
ncbi:MAG: tRNA uridine(34) 5-carboxymethylaminomethyl modification radical SAM/GNAT enzyme Elp3 [Nitrososphaerales archaeon]|nr:tRNA uridine(34) 5-carboxymethylaminomethyl modification radical SAM/GNAT enzyme Elp3 [Nitrososphaerales archaeon]